MSLLLLERDPEFLKLTNEIFMRQLADDRRLNDDLSDHARRKMYQDVQYNVDFLHTALLLGDDHIFAKHARWLYQLLSSLMTYCSRERLRDILTAHFQLIKICTEKTISPEQHLKLHHLLDCAIQALADECEHSTLEWPESVKYKAETRRYLDCLLQSDSQGARSLITEYIKSGIPLSDICVDIISGAMRQVGEMWHRNLISVDMEHFCTSVTQLALSQLYPLIFGQERKGKTVLVACVGSELHEIGARMVADLFEYNGWDSIYLGAAVPIDAIESSVATYQPDLTALSVTMPQHLPLCGEAVKRLRKSCPQLKIAVGGNAFSDTEVWKNWAVDIYTRDARNLVQWADNTL